jgi:penicillin-insensitive murein endopeptidase
MARLLGEWARWVNDEMQSKLVIGDISQPLGGPASDGHASHQIGLDSDIRFFLMPADQIIETENNYETPLMVKYWSEPLNAKKTKFKYFAEFQKDLWDPRLDALLEKVGQEPLVQRVFVNAPIKRHLCETFKQADGSYPLWLEKMRPEAGHVYHFHVRLRCPEDSPHCIAQEGIVKDPSDKTGVGCGGENYEWWFSQGVLKKELSNPESVPSAPALSAPAVPYWKQVMDHKAFPAQCKDLLKQTH